MGAQGMDMKVSLSEPDYLNSDKYDHCRRGWFRLIPTDGLAASEFVEMPPIALS